MIRTAAIVPAILTADPQAFQAEMLRVATYAKRVQIDITDGVLAKSPTIPLTNVAWTQGMVADLHLMLARPSQALPTILKLHPSLCILHAEASENLLPVYEQLKAAGIRTGVALVPSTYPGLAKPYIDVVDHVLIFAGQLGVQGSPADMMQTEKIALIRAMKPEVEIGWDGGANLSNIRALAHADLDVINVGSALSRVQDPAAAYRQMVAEVDKSGVVI